VIPYFDDDQAWAEYKAILLSWVGTPFRHMWSAKGRGTDCTLFLGSAMLEHGILTKLEYDYYPKDWHIHTQEEIVMDTFYRHIQNNMAPGYGVEWLPSVHEELKRGDILGFSTTSTGVTNHCGIVMDFPKPFMINCINQRGVRVIPVVSWWFKYLKNIFRVVKETD